MKIELDDWQRKILDTKGNICLRSGRQVGKSTVISIKAAEYAAKNRRKVIMVISSTERQAGLLLEKILSHLLASHKALICVGHKKPTRHRIELTNGSVVYCLPTGLSGYGIRGYSVDLLIADEAAFIHEDVWTAVTPMLAVTKGTIILLSTPHGKSGFYYRCFNDSVFTSFHISSEACERVDKKFLEQEKKRMTKLQYAQEYLGEFIDELRQFFPTETIQRCMFPKETIGWGEREPKYLGVDVARMGADQSVLFSVAKVSQNECWQVDMEITEKTLLTETIARIKNADRRYEFKKIYIDDGGMGVGVFDPLLQDPQTRRKVVAINNASRSLDNDDRGRKKILKEDLYNNLLYLMESGQIKLWEDDEIMLSLKSVQAEYDDGKLKIFGNYTHITEALIRAAWCMKSKSLNIWIR